jgi:hypothetical protein
MYDIRYLMRLTSFAGMFFASTAGLTDAGAVDAGGGGGEAAVADGGEAEVITDDGAAPTDTVEDQTSEVTDETQPGESVTPKEPTTQDITKALNKLRESDKVSADMLRKAFFKQETDLRNFRSAFGSPAEASETKELLDSIGGSDGLSQLQNEAQSYANELGKMSTGDPTIIKDLARDFPEGLKKLVPAGLEELRQVAPKNYEHLAARITSTALRDYGISRTIEQIGLYLSVGKTAEVGELVNKLQQWIEGTERFSQSKPAEDAEASNAFRQREEELGRKEAAAYNRQLNGSIVSSWNSTIAKNLQPLLKTRNLSADQKKDLVSGIFNELSESLKANERYQERFKAIKAKGNVEEATRFATAAVEKIAKRATDAAWAKRGFASATRKSQPTNGNANGAAVQVTKKPADDTIDFSKDPGRLRFMAGEATLRGGRVVKWSWDEQ